MTAGNSIGMRAKVRRSDLNHTQTRRTQRLAPGAIGICLVMILGAFGFLFASPTVGAAQVGPAGPACIKCPDGVHCYPNCGPPPPPCNPNLYTVQVTHLQMSNHSTNVTITWQESPNFSNTSNWFNWGNTTSYGYTLNPSYNGVTYTVFLDFLEPQTVYYFQIEIVPSYHSCTTEYEPSSYYSTFTTLSENVYVSQYGGVIRGVVYNANGQTAPAGLEVYLQCTGYNLWSQYAFTNALGAYSISSALGATGCTTNGKGYYIVEVLNSVITNPGNPSMQWPGYWNESVVIWAAQFVNFVLPSNYVSSYIPVITDFSNANSSNGLAGYSTINYLTGTTYTTSEKDCSTAGFTFGGCYTNSTQFGAGSIYQSTNGNLFVSQQYWTSGLVIIDGINRTGWTASQSYYATYGYPQYPALQPITDWLTPSTYLSHNAYPMPGWGDQGGGRPIYYQHSIGGYVTTSTTQATTGVKDLAISVDISYYVGIGFQVADLSWSQTSSTTAQNTLNWMAQVPVNTPVPTCFVVYGQGGSASAGTADIIGIWAYASTYSGGQYTCGAPH